MTTIDRGIPIPEEVKREMYPWEKLEIGDSFIVRCSTRASARVQIWRAKRRLNFEFTMRPEEGFFRIWRTK